MNNLPVGILLAAGQSRRFDGNKLHHPVLDDTPMIIASAQILRRALPRVVVVINKTLTMYTRQLEALGMKVVINEYAELGMGSSLATGVRASKNATGWLIALADMPYLKPETIMLLAKRMSDGAEIVAPVFEQQRGHPVGFSHHYLDELTVLNEDVGARKIINNHRENLELVTVSDKGIIIDIDYASELA